MFFKTIHAVIHMTEKSDITLSFRILNKCNVLDASFIKYKMREVLLLSIFHNYYQEYCT